MQGYNSVFSFQKCVLQCYNSMFCFQKCIVQCYNSMFSKLLGVLQWCNSHFSKLWGVLQHCNATLQKLLAVATHSAGNRRRATALFIVMWVNTHDCFSQNLTTKLLKNRIQRIIRIRFYEYLIGNGGLGVDLTRIMSFMALFP